MARRALGKGLEALIPGIPEEPTDEGQRVIEINVSEISPNPYQPRMDFDPESIAELKRSILEKGVIQPIAVRRFGQDYQLIVGERRLRAAREAGMETIPALVMEVSSPEEMLELSLIENVQREDLNPIEEARAYRALIEQCSLTQEEVSKKVGKDRSTVANLLRLLRLPPEVQDRLYDGEISVGHARALLPIEDEKVQAQLCRETIRQGLSVRRVEQLAKSRAPRVRAKKVRARAERDPLLISLEEELQRLLGTSVRIIRRGRRGRIEIEFYGEEDLDRVVELLKVRLAP